MCTALIEVEYQQTIVSMPPWSLKNDDNNNRGLHILYNFSAELMLLQSLSKSSSLRRAVL